ncbi:MAG: Gfo/Idh/MocA family oxidoreductase, partial [Candidatus Thiodiazotropha taylori]|nr:Gfo/Idh/MocA family oxidoreductase [Candidatus Thiodiazotropha taylori]
MQFAHGFHAEEVEKNDPGLAWRVSPEASGPSYVLGDVGTHCLQMGHLISGLEMESLSCMRKSFVESRQLEDDAHVMIKYKNGAVGTLWASAVAVGNIHSFKVEVIGEKGTLRWFDELPNQLEYAPLGKPFRQLDRGMSYLYDLAGLERLGSGHPEG